MTESDSHEVRARPVRPRRATPGQAAAAVLAFALAFASVLATTLLIGRPDARQRVDELWAAAPLRYLDPPADEPAVEIARLRLERDRLQARLAAAQTLDMTVTGSVGERPGEVGGRSIATPPALLGVDLGAQPSLADARRSWSQLRRRLAPDRYQAVVAIEDGAGGARLRLVVGPVERAEDVGRLCGRLAVTGCRPAIFEGQRLPLHESAR